MRHGWLREKWHSAELSGAPDALVDFHTVSHGSEPSFAGLQTPKAFVMDLSTSESNGNAKSNFSWKALFAATASQLTP